MSTPILANFINGQFVAPAGSGLLNIVDPSTGDTVARAPVSVGSDIDDAMAAARAAFPGWSRRTPSERQRALLLLADAVDANSDSLVEAQHRNTGQPRATIAADEVAAGADQLRFFAGAARLLEGKSAGEYLEGMTSWVRREPIGVVGQVTPWNFPLLMAIWKIGPALAVGNTLVLKPSDTTPESTLELARISQGILPDGVMNIVLGDATTGSLIVEHPVPGLVSITGSVRAGMAVAAGAAHTLKRAHLELGGKAPAVVFDDVDVEKTAAAIADFSFYNAGQDCTAITRVLVQESIHDGFVAAFTAEAERRITGAPSDADNYFGPLNNERHFSDVVGKVAALPEHAVITTGGHRVGETGFFFEPTVVTQVRQSDAIVQDETFGPVITVQSFRTEEEAITMANDVRYALASSVWTRDHARALRVSRDLDFGAVWINTHILLTAEMPHGGFKYSGYGKDLSMYGVEDYTRIKHVMSALE
ncbi:aldehyde dehydrogenase (NAD+) [Glaciihabitans tibetensis]|uniref:Aldehyde dehydrogenase (NAD+) n=1 Tax=Glaciihabitans tibetensis TaxID=1266600 RepID=A0A2T0V729_9MICO|nr:aminobutyraldehyde dehydrogenase [Glaciihabitans tibetensis]PRY65954.1 aldehyde dehydrogenase (NAD+) [Glaciihabitans tibetensis]